ncbi:MULTISPECIES: WxcM-like domain-containing protein [Chryseobacterium]|uniref:WxcM-like, C-terminal n=1 Tax=Chryseobacterium profundimaris TaxID=1387275 RepID=A0ABY1PGI7_9FLAO|nr:MULTISPECIES: WxcM-like domain-containing protein [Chryseobacterium]MEA1850856.1 WxcM-like domain-containing protein [Chryseobacterium sp. MHB01]SMP31588.1 WxcM-like, C-terminal [Chryseobacterium profundimaris]
MEKPMLIQGKSFADDRGSLFFNNDFNASQIKRIYFIENRDTQFIRGWTGHKTEQRWFSATQGSFTINLIKIDNWEKPSENLPVLKFELNSENLDILHVPPGYASAIQSHHENSRLLVMADYALGEITDDYRFPINYFENLK